MAFAMLSEAGHYTGTFRLARRLAARGHRVVYLGLADFAHLAAAQGFDFVPFADDLLPAGYVPAFAASLADRPRGPRAWWRRRRDDERRFEEYLRRIADGSLDRALAATGAELLLCDTFVWYVALRALRAGIPTLSVSVPLALHANPRVPPIVSSIDPARCRWPALRVWIAWKALRARSWLTKRLASSLTGAYRHPTRMHHLTHVFRGVARRSGRACREGKTYHVGEMGPRLTLPEIVLCPEAFQLPGAPDEAKLYVGDFIDIERHEEALPNAALDPGKPLVYASLGTSAVLYPHAARFYRAVAGAGRLRPDWQFALHVGDHPEASGLPGGPNVFVARRVPQLALLRRAAVMLNHAGLNSVLECIHFQVPMAVFPGLRDQPGNAVRALRHGVALAGDMATATPESVADLAARAMADPSLRAALSRLKRRIEADDGLERAAALVERTMEGREQVARRRAAGAPGVSPSRAPGG